MNKAIAINIVEGNAEPNPNGAILKRNIIPPLTPSLNKFFLVNKRKPATSCPVAIKLTNSAGFEPKVP